MFRKISKVGVKKEVLKLKRKIRRKNPNAVQLENELKDPKHFGGIFSQEQLKNIIILKYPVILLVIVNQHWITLYIDKSSFEVYDSLMDICEYEDVLRFIKNNLFFKTLKIFPQIQSNDNFDCAFFAKFFIKAKSNQIPFKTLLNLFSSNFKLNSKLVRAGFNATVFSD